MAQVSSISAVTGFQRLRDRIWRIDLFPAFRHPALLLFILVWVVSVSYLAITGYAGFVQIALTTAGTTLALALITLLVTADKDRVPPHQRESPETRPWLWGQVVFLCVLLIFTGISIFYYQKLAGPNSLAAALGRPLEGLPFGIRNPLLLGALPLAGLCLLRARFRNLGLGPGRHVWILTALWCALPMFKIIQNVVAGSLTLDTLGLLLLSHLLQNGFYEEFLLRGALQTRLALLLDPIWALVLQALAFGAWHIALGLVVTGIGSVPGTDVLAALAVNMTFHAVSGFGYGLVFWRSGNIIAPSIVHIISNTAGV